MLIGDPLCEGSSASSTHEELWSGETIPQSEGRLEGSGML